MCLPEPVTRWLEHAESDLRVITLLLAADAFPPDPV